MNQQLLLNNKDILFKIITDFEHTHNLNETEKKMLNRLEAIIKEIDLSNIDEKKGMLSYFIRDSFDIEGFPVSSFLKFDQQLTAS